METSVQDIGRAGDGESTFDDEEFWESVPVFPDREKEARSVIREKLNERKQAFKSEYEERNKLERAQRAEEEIDVSLHARKQAFFDDASDRETVIKTSTALSVHLDETSLNDRKQAFLDDAAERNNRRGSSLSDDITEGSLHERKKAFFDDAKNREKVDKTSTALSEHLEETTLHDRKQAFLQDADERGRFQRTEASEIQESLLSDRKKAFFQDASEREKFSKTEASEIQGSIHSERTKAFFDEASQREKFRRTDTQEGVDMGVIANRRASFRKKDAEIQAEKAVDVRENVSKTQHRARMIKDENQLFKVLNRRRAKLEVEEEIKEQFPEEGSVNSQEDSVDGNNNSVEESTSEKILDESKSEYGWKV
ncbi:myosin heavy chain, clone 203-like isoform X2 [Clytia hemisphaerica]|uniref:myosin heavy chain, clone 203-like isoform X2 n=1 Tax=Clytia hemisphaerica TaxID=252671 RepID=UPI0034D3E93B